MKAKRQKIKPFKLKLHTCEQLHNILTGKPGDKEPANLTRIRRWFATQPAALKHLKLCRSLSAQYHRQYIQTASLLEQVPEIALMIGGGKPRQPDMPRWSYSLKKIGELNGIVIHRWGKGAFRMKKREAPSALEE